MLSALGDVRFRSKADMRSAKRHVRFTPNSGHAAFGITANVPTLFARGSWADLWVQQYRVNNHEANQRPVFTISMRLSRSMSAGVLS